jgi:hypothetical protein
MTSACRSVVNLRDISPPAHFAEEDTAKDVSVGASPKYVKRAKSVAEE